MFTSTTLQETTMRQRKYISKAVNLPNSSADEEGEHVGDEESVEDITGEEGGVAHHDTADACPAAHSLARMTEPPFPAGVTRCTVNKVEEELALNLINCKL